MQQAKVGSSTAVSRSANQTIPSDNTSRRGFFTKLAAAMVGLVVIVVPFVLGLVTFFAPLGRRAKGNLVRVASLEDIPPDGIPRRFPVVAQRRDAWNVYPPQPIGSVFLRRTSTDGLPEAVTSVCPHLGCAVDFLGPLGHYQCPCHNSAWHADGTRMGPETSPSPRDLDELKVEVRDGQVWVDYQQFRSGISQQVPV